MVAELLPVSPGKIASVVTYLEAYTPLERPDRPLPSYAGLQPIGSDCTRYLALFRRVGAPWLWFSRLVMDEAELLTILDNPCVEAYALVVDGCDIGLLEIDARRAPAEVELAFIGVVSQYVGQGLGGPLIDFALQRCWSYNPLKITVHSCTLDHPKALSLYLESGFVAVKRAIEIADDPRLLGLLPRHTACQAPLIE